MKKLALFILVVFIFSEVVVATQAKDSSVPYIRFDQEWWDFGKIDEGVKVSHVFKVENVGSADLVIKVRPGCGCTVASVSSETIKPGETAKIEVVFDSKGYQGQGTVTKSIYVDSNDPKVPLKILVIFGEVRASSPEINISIAPQIWKFFVLPEKETTGELTIRNEGQQELNIEGISTFSSQYEISIPTDKISPQSYTTLTLKIKPGEESKGSSGYIYLEIAIPFTIELEK